MQKLFVPGYDELHAQTLFWLYQSEPDDEAAIAMLNDGLIGRTREDAERWIAYLDSIGEPTEGVKIFEFDVTV